MDFKLLYENISNSRVSSSGDIPSAWNANMSNLERFHYSNKDERLGIDFQVTNLPFAGLQVMDPRLVTIAPGACNEKHRHAHESIFVLLSGQGKIVINKQAIALETGSVAYVPRWVVHQSRNTSTETPLLLLAITDFGLTSAVLGDYDAKTRLKSGGVDAYVVDPSTESNSD
jgi:mannose-6-phosphate isomerase-like protein (cupin superfamily)